MAKIWKVYAQNINRPRKMAVYEITKSDLEDEKIHIFDRVLNLLNMDTIKEEEEEYFFDALLTLIDEEWEKYGLWGCGDYNIILAEDTPSRPNMASNTMFSLDEIKNKMNELKKEYGNTNDYYQN